ncbi:MAG: hypothetical protein IKC34_01005, partial [Clostridia bacterium]|nr:hypothetical protein [Clostridia bacterium]
LCHPCGMKLTIPAFSLYYILAVSEYTKNTGDVTLAREVMPKMREICDAFINSRPGALIKLTGENMWNFYDWAPMLNGEDGTVTDEPDLIINALLLLALSSVKLCCEAAGLDFPYAREREELREAIRESFLTESGLFKFLANDEAFTVLGNSLAILSGAATPDEAKVIADEIIKDTMRPTSLSMSLLKYDALLATDAEKYKDYILAEIRRTYKIMLDAGSDTVWETILGEADFNGAGSLCHGWSAVPVHVYRKLGMVKE